MADTVESKGASPAAIRKHYDISNDFYRLWLDSSLTYSCALFEEGDTLEAAQRRKIDYLLEGCRARGAKRLLDVGCGWGSVLRRAIAAMGVERGTGLTLSDAQAQWIKQSADPRIEVRQESWTEHRAVAPYDAIISIGAMEHFCRRGLKTEQRVAVYRDFFRACHAQLAPGGWMSLQTICRGNVTLDGQGMEDVAFIFSEIFEETDLPGLSDIVLAANRLFEVVTLRNDRAHYARTCDMWLDSLRVNRAAAVEVVGEAQVRKYERYLEASIRQFERDFAGLVRLSLRRV